MNRPTLYRYRLECMTYYARPSEPRVIIAASADEARRHVRADGLIPVRVRTAGPASITDVRLAEFVGQPR